MNIKEIYYAEHSSNVYVEDESGNLYQWNVHAPGAPLRAVPHRPRQGLIRCDNNLYKGYAASLRAFGYTVEPRLGRPAADPANPRDKQVGIRVSQRELDLLDSTAAKAGLSRTDLIIAGVNLMRDKLEAGK